MLNDLLFLSKKKITTSISSTWTERNRTIIEILEKRKKENIDLKWYKIIFKMLYKHLVQFPQQFQFPSIVIYANQRHDRFPWNRDEKLRWQIVLPGLITRPSVGRISYQTLLRHCSK